MSSIIQPVSVLPQAPLSAAGVKGPDEARNIEEPSLPHRIRSASDEYVPEEKREPVGRYWLEKDENGMPEIHFDSPEQKTDEAPDRTGKDGKPSPAENAESSEKPPDSKSETCTGSTDKVDREIKNLKKKLSELKQQLSAETDDAEISRLRDKLKQVESELRQKDNDAYRRRHTEFS